MNNTRGQTSLLLILLAAAALILFAITLNWGRIAQVKTMTQIAATTGVSQLASQYASYGESVLQTTLGGRWKYCKSTSIWEVLITLVIAIIVLVVALVCTPCGIPVLGAFLSLVLAVANLALQVMVVQPGLTQLWNRMQKNLPLSGQFAEQALQTALTAAVNDTAVVGDYFDLNTNGHFGASSAGVPEDTISRFGFYYTERLKSINPPNVDVLSNFRNELSAFIHGHGAYSAMALNAPCGPDPNSLDPHCNPCCVVSDRPQSCTQPQIDNCANNSVWKYASMYPWVYDPTYPNYYAFDSQNNFLSKFGVDAEAPSTVVMPAPNPPYTQATFKKDDTLPVNGTNHYGMFNFMWDLDSLLTDPNRAPVSTDSNNLYLLNCSGCPGTSYCDAICDYRFSDAVNPDAMVNFEAPDDVCAQTQNTTTTIYPWWKKGTDLFCSASWPYDQCGTQDCDASNPDPGNPNSTSCGCIPGPTTAPQYRNDPMDDLVYGLKEFYAWSAKITDPAVSSLDLTNTIDQWYSQALYWMGPPCNGSNTDRCFCDNINDTTCGGNVADPHNGGMLYRYRSSLDQWQAQVNSWLAATYTAPNAWCLPPTADGLPAAEVGAINAGGATWGSLQSVTQCLDYNATNNYEKFRVCYDQIKDYGHCATNPAMPATCYASIEQWPRTPNAAVLPGWDPCGYTDTTGYHPSRYVAWVRGSMDIARAQKDRFEARSATLTQMKITAEKVAAAMGTFRDQIKSTSGGILNSPTYTAFFSNPLSSLQNNASLSKTIIYGWQDLKAPPSRHDQSNGYWHIVKVEAPMLPYRLPWVRTYCKGFLCLTRCYELTDKDGVVKIRVTRWDQDHDPTLFANKVPLWQVLFHAGPANNPASLTANCSIGSPPPFVGVSSGTLTQLNTSIINDTITLDRLKRAFMFGGDANDNRGYMNTNCFSMVNALLNDPISGGVSSEVCASYDLDAQQRHLTVKFVRCP